ncbi:hypothetical protein EDD22DRAFT_847214 [Suillus occidentalis]|nr:hypothetical protein EDD22DRAFT_847214 [Suillus occidentalis]
MSFLPTFFNKSAQLQRYKLLTCLTTYSGSVYALAISNDGNLLACGGKKADTQPYTGKNSHLHLTIMNPGEQKTAAETLCYGTGLGYIIFLRHSLTNIAVGTRDKIVQVLTLNASLQLQSVFTSVAFADNRDVYVFGLYDGNFTKLKDEDGSVVQEMSCKSVIGHAAVRSKWGVFVVDNAADGFTLYRLDGDGEPVQTFATAIPSMSLPNQVAFGEEGKVVVGGSNNELMGDLHGCCTIASASTAPGHGKTTIKIWAYD